MYIAVYVYIYIYMYVHVIFGHVSLLGATFLPQMGFCTILTGAEILPEALAQHLEIWNSPSHCEVSSLRLETKSPKKRFHCW